MGEQSFMITASNMSTRHGNTVASSGRSTHRLNTYLHCLMSLLPGRPARTVPLAQQDLHNRALEGDHDDLETRTCSWAGSALAAKVHVPPVGQCHGRKTALQHIALSTQTSGGRNPSILRPAVLLLWQVPPSCGHRVSLTSPTRDRAIAAVLSMSSLSSTRSLPLIYFE